MRNIQTILYMEFTPILLWGLTQYKILLTRTPPSSRQVLTILWVHFHPAFLWGFCPIHELYTNTFSLQVQIPEFFILKVVTCDRIPSETVSSASKRLVQFLCFSLSILRLVDLCKSFDSLAESDWTPKYLLPHKLT